MTDMVMSFNNFKPAQTMNIITDDSQPIRIYTLGHFEIVLRGAPVRFAFKAPRRPLELLKGLSAQRGRALSQHTLCDLLWPELDPLSATRALRTTVFRLRQVLGHKRAVLVCDGQVALNADCCWVDAWAFEQMLTEANSPAAIENALHVYRGPFLNEFEHPLAFEARERLRRKYVRSVLQLGQQYQDSGNSAAAIELYESAVGIEAAAEDVHRELLVCLARDGSAAAAVAAYQRCRAILARRYGVTPSVAIEQAIRKVLRSTGPVSALRQVAAL